MTEILATLCQHQDLSPKQMQCFLSAIFEGNISPAMLGAILIALKMKPESPQEIASAAIALKTNLPGIAGSFVDNCGTGGDGASSINISTISALLCASMGVKMAKHGNKSSSGRGSADLLEALGVNTQMCPTQLKNCLEKTNFAFLFAPLYYPSFAKIAPIRKELKIRTLFNLLGPLLNPLPLSAQLLGVYDKSLCLPLASVLKKLGVPRAMVVHTAGVDEIALHGEIQVCELQGGRLLEYALSPQDFGLQAYALEQMISPSLEYSVQVCLEVLQGRGQEAHRAIIAANSAALLVLSGLAGDLKEGTALSLEQMHSQKGYQHLQKIVTISHA
ncbi:anthranilate phosphoribosyltransferase [Helicobacter bizzozeronii]|uniref:anthranilate phosphoribosyltransferase n=1 Tax=Helicobacter bizzozeronii TaxID=56877 RepID=UPI000CEE7C8E|nr:anthranilate phosphoribosyltransferase [Helicobacter bizzozeronii]